MGLTGQAHFGFTTPHSWSNLHITTKVSIILLLLTAASIALLSIIYTNRLSHGIAAHTSATLIQNFSEPFHAPVTPVISPTLLQDDTSTEARATDSPGTKPVSNTNITTITVNGRTISLSGDGSQHETITSPDGSTRTSISIDHSSSSSGESSRSRVKTRVNHSSSSSTSQSITIH